MTRAQRRIHLLVWLGLLLLLSVVLAGSFLARPGAHATLSAEVGP